MIEQNAAMWGSVLVVIPTLNEAAMIGPVLDSLLHDLPLGRAVRCCVVDGGSSDGTQALVKAYAERRPEVGLLDNPKRLQSAGVNLAARLDGGASEWLVRCDAHAIYPPGFVRRLVEAQSRTGADSVVVPMDSIGRNCVQKAVAWVSDTKIGSGGSAHRGGRSSGFVDHGHHALMRMESFRRVGGYDETFAANEDAEFDCRLRATGGTIFLDADIRLGYYPRATFTRLAKQYFRYGAGRSRTVRRHPKSLRLRQFAVPAFLMLCVLALAISPVQPWFLLLPGFYAAVLLAASASVALRHRSLCGLLAGPAALTMHAAWAAGFLAGLLSGRERPWRPEPALAAAAGTGTGPVGR